MSELKPYALRIDGPLLRNQRKLLLRIAATVRNNRRYEPSSGDESLLEGLLSLTDGIADQAHDRHLASGCYTVGLLVPIQTQLDRMAMFASRQVAVVRTQVSISLVGFCRVLMHSMKFFQCGTFIAPILGLFTFTASAAAFGRNHPVAAAVHHQRAFGAVERGAVALSNSGIGLHVRLS